MPAQTGTELGNESEFEILISVVLSLVQPILGYQVQ